MSPNPELPVLGSDEDCAKHIMRQWGLTVAPEEMTAIIARHVAARTDKLVEALEVIAKPTYGTELMSTDAERSEIYWGHIHRFQNLARAALAQHKAAA